MILAQHRIEATEAELVQAAHMQFGGVDIEELARLAKRYGLRAELRQLDLAAIAELIEEDIFPIAYVNRVHVDNLPIRTKVAVHAVVVTGVSQRFVTFHDPRPGKQRRVPKRTFAKSQRELSQWCVVCQRA
jgi:ABC-type bacteriocin/lantibiotic exporter with double-glycine peptidase domain